MDKIDKQKGKTAQHNSKTIIGSTKTNKVKEDKELDKKLKDTFPASDSTAQY